MLLTRMMTEFEKDPNLALYDGNLLVVIVTSLASAYGLL
jgi:hypothetical protein